MNYVVPESLQTARLNLRMFLEKDWKDMHEYFSDPECMRVTSGRQFNENERWQRQWTLHLKKNICSGMKPR